MPVILVDVAKECTEHVDLLGGARRLGVHSLKYPRNGLHRLRLPELKSVACAPQDQAHLAIDVGEQIVAPAHLSNKTLRSEDAGPKPLPRAPSGAARQSRGVCVALGPVSCRKAFLGLLGCTRGGGFGHSG